MDSSSRPNWCLKDFWATEPLIPPSSKPLAQPKIPKMKTEMYKVLLKISGGELSLLKNFFLSDCFGWTTAAVMIVCACVSDSLV